MIFASPQGDRNPQPILVKPHTRQSGLIAIPSCFALAPVSGLTPGDSEKLFTSFGTKILSLPLVTNLPLPLLTISRRSAKPHILKFFRGLLSPPPTSFAGLPAVLRCQRTAKTAGTAPSPWTFPASFQALLDGVAETSISYKASPVHLSSQSDERGHYSPTPPPEKRPWRRNRRSSSAEGGSR